MVSEHDHQNFDRTNRPRFKLVHLCGRVLNPVMTRGRREEMGKGPAMQPSTNRDFSLWVLVQNLILDLICVP